MLPELHEIQFKADGKQYDGALLTEIGTIEIPGDDRNPESYPCCIAEIQNRLLPDRLGDILLIAKTEDGEHFLFCYVSHAERISMEEMDAMYQANDFTCIPKKWNGRLESPSARLACLSEINAGLPEERLAVFRITRKQAFEAFAWYWMPNDFRADLQREG